MEEVKHKRIGLSKKTRFEVFKRDSFTCQYCGNKAPEVTLEVDHIKPVAKSGDNNLINLITSCFDCNRGKSDRTLDDNAVIEKQNEQLQALNERKIQLEMMMEWKTELLNLNDDLVEALINYFVELKSGDVAVNESGRKKMKSWLKKYSFETLLEATEKSVGQYEETEKSFNMIPKIAYYVDNPQEDYMQELFYIRGIARNRFNYFNDQQGIILLRKAYSIGIETSVLRELTLETDNWTKFRNAIEELIEEEV